MASLRDLDLRQDYGYGADLLDTFYVPVLRCARRYDRAVAFFNSRSLAGAAAGLNHFIHGGGSIRLLVSPNNWHVDDIKALYGQEKVPTELAQRLAQVLVPQDEIEARHLSVLAWLVQEGRLETRILTHPDGELYHQKLGILQDAAGDTLAFCGSANESLGGWRHNAEILHVACGWKSSEQAQSVQFRCSEFVRFWEGQHPFRTIPLPQAVVDQILSLAPQSPPWPGDSAVPVVKRIVKLFPHQDEGVVYLTKAYPQSRLLADEVGLGKTVTAAAALMQLRQSGQCVRTLILAPANVCVQWQEELHDKFGLSCPRLADGQFHYVDGQRRPMGESNPFDVHGMLIVSSYLVRLPRWQQKLNAAGTYDLIVLDEAHHARRSAPASTLQRGEYQPTRLLQLLSGTLCDKSRCIWLLTATPIQLHLVEFFDLLRHLIGESEPQCSPLRSWEAFDEFYTALRNPDVDEGWVKLGQGIAGFPPQDSSLYSDLGPASQRRITHFGQGNRDAMTDAEHLQREGYQDRLLHSLRARSPGGRLMLRRTRQDTDMQDMFAVRRPQKVEIEFGTTRERDLYRDLDDFLLKLRQGKPQGYGLMLAQYRKRLASSWSAVYLTIRRALDPTQAASDELELLEMGVDLAATDADSDLFRPDRLQFAPQELQVLQKFAASVEEMAHNPLDPKLAQLHQDVDACRRNNETMLVFTQFWDTLAYVRDSLPGRYGHEVACYSGQGGSRWEKEAWVPIARTDLVRELNAGAITLLICTDAASEGLNLQAASTLVNYELPWNPMRVEQRIGRIDRIHQQVPHLTIRNYVMKGTVEDRVYEALVARIDTVEAVIGGIQPILSCSMEDLIADGAETAVFSDIQI